MEPQQTQQVIDMVQKAADALSEKLGVAAPHIWEILVRQGIIVGVLGIVGFVAASVVFALVVRAYLRFRAKFIAGVSYPQGREPDADDYPFMLVLVLVVSGFTFIGATVNVCFAILKLLNPEFYAMSVVTSFLN